MWSAMLQRLVRLLLSPLVLVLWIYSQALRVTTGRPPVPPVTNRLLMYSAAELAALIRARKVNCLEVIEAYVERVKEVNPVINAVVQDRFDLALQEAAELDLHLSNTDKTEEQLAKDSPLLGVPVTIKETISVAGMSNGAGVPGWDRVAPKDAEAVTALRDAGAIPLLVSNTPELCLTLETYNPVSGRTYNPYDSRRTPGGSSGGEAALMSCAASVVGLGTDIGGSGRVPPSFCGLFGHKPSSGYISVEGHMPSSDDPMWQKVFAFTPMARYAGDLPLLMKACTSDKRKLQELRIDEPVDLMKVKFYYMEENGSKVSEAIHSDVKTALQKVITHIEDTFQTSVTKMEVNELRYSAELCLFLMMKMKPCHNIFQKTFDNLTEWKSVFWETVRWAFCLSPHTLHALLYGIVKRLVDAYPPRAIKNMEKCAATITDKLHGYLGEDGVLLCPVFPTSAVHHMQATYKMTSAGYIALFNLLDMPATACPVYRNRRGLPVGIQVVAGRRQDRLNLAVAQELERAFGGWEPPTGSNLTNVKV